ncbi:putative phosphatidylinositol-3,4,5-trisphosphate 3-phosphatase [Sporobolomyces salmoneus]|uniref:putative phosphatidylinositol-3,4,5-trisphosphate 3-phosphatase n=1 Tax=Sporobolomyces salmoneus TaxID=183962 RepID=UPI003180CFB9
MLNTIRGIVSGKKARYQEEGFDLDLVRVTDRMIIMGYPAAGLASLYRNKRSDVLKFLEPYAPHYRIFNLCPLYENSYDANEIAHENVKREEGNSAVERYPWPDHHPPPLSMFRIMVEGAKKWYEADERNVIVIHCKAGKGRSGTFAISILMALPNLPSEPSSPNKRQTIQAGKEEEGDGSGTGEAEDSTDPTTTRDLPQYSKEDAERLGMNEKLDWLLKFHTHRRMKPNVKNLGVSISSQRRFLRYWARLLEGDDPRSLPSTTSGKRLVVLEYVRVIGDGLKGPQGRIFGVGNDKIAVQVWKYKNSIVDNLRERELDLLNGVTKQGDDETNWNDRDTMFERIGGFVESAQSPPSSGGATNLTTSSSRSTLEVPRTETDENALEEYASTASTVSPYPSSSGTSTPHPSATSTREKYLIPHSSYLSPASTTVRSDSEAKSQVEKDGGIVIDGEREIMLKFLVGETGKKHGKLPTMAALAISWFIPLFEQPGQSGEKVRMTLGAKDLDFVKSFAGIDQVEIGWRWV